MPQRSRLLLVALIAAVFALGTGLPTRRAQAQDSWQSHMAAANSFYRNRLLPKAQEELKAVVADPEGAKHLKAWQLIIEIAGKMKDLDTLIWALESGRELAEGQEAAQMQAQLYRLKRVYGRVVFQATGGSGKLPAKGIALKAKADIDDPEAKAYFEKARILFSQQGYALGSGYLPAGEYELDGAPLKIVAGKDTMVEVAPTTDVRFALEIVGVGGMRLGDTATGASGGLAGLDIGVGPHIQFASGNSLVIHVGPIAMFAAQQTPNVVQDDYVNHSAARTSIGGTLMVGFEFNVGGATLSPRLGFAAHYLASGMYYRGKVVSSPTGLKPTVIEGSYIVPALAYGPRIGFQALVTPALNERGKRVPRVFVGLHGGPIWAQPMWGEVGAGAGVDVQSTALRGEDDGQAGDLRNGPFQVWDIVGEDEMNNSKVFADIHAVVGIQVRL
jgi:hypothetical protein